MDTWAAGDGGAGAGSSLDAVTGAPGGCVTPAMALWNVDCGVR